MTPEEQSKSAGEILAAMRNMEVPGAEVTHPGEQPCTTGMTEEARNRTVSEYDGKLNAHVDYLLNTKPSSKWTRQDRETIGRGIAGWDSGGRM